MKRISVVMPIYNTGKYLHRSIESILAQRECLADIVLVDDGSTDESPAICDRYGQEYPDLIKVIHQSNQGIGAARNAGIQNSVGEYISFIDSDDYIDPGMYEQLLGLIDEYHSEMAAIAMWIEQPDGSRYCRVPESIRCCWNTEEALIEVNSYLHFYNSVCNTLIARSVFDNLRFPLIRRCEDYALLYKIVASCSKVAYASVPMYHYVQTPNSTSRTTNISHAPIDVSDNQLEFFKTYFPDIIYVAETECVFARLSIYSCYVRNSVPCPPDVLRRLKRVSRRYIGVAICNKHIPFIKKLQALTFCFATPVYRLIIKRTSHR